MGNYKPYFKYLNDVNKKVLFIFSIIICVNTITSISGLIESGFSHNGSLVYTSQASATSGIIIFLAGMFYSLQLFSQAMSIRADRVGYIKATILWGIILSIGLAIFGYTLDSISKIIAETITGNNVEIYSQTMWIDIDRFRSSMNIFSRVFSNLAIFSISFMLGAIWYRLKIKYSILIFVILPICIGTYMVNYGFRNPENMSLIGLKIFDTLGFIIQNQMISISVKSIIILICTLMGIKLLIKAPIKDYANDLI